MALVTLVALAVRLRCIRDGIWGGTSWFAPGKGLVKLVFHHGDGSVSTVVLLK